MSNETKTTERQTAESAIAIIGPERLPYHPAIEERFGYDRATWRALVEAVYPAATSTQSVILALSYCRARKLDPFKRVVHIVPIWDRQKGKMVDTVWPGIGELRTTAFRTGVYAGRDDADFGADVTMKVGNIEMTFPEWCRVTVYRMVREQRVAFAGPKVYWLETYATKKRDDKSPNEMWERRTRGQLEKCAEAAALRAAFPEEIGDDLSSDEAEGIAARSGPVDITPRGTSAAEVVANLTAQEPETTEHIDEETGEVTEESRPQPEPAPKTVKTAATRKAAPVPQPEPEPEQDGPHQDADDPGPIQQMHPEAERGSTGAQQGPATAQAQSAPRKGRSSLFS